MATNKKNFITTGSNLCSIVLLAIMLFVLPQIILANTAQPQNLPHTEQMDFDGDKLDDIRIETELLTVVFSSKTGAPSLYYLKGKNFEENLYPPFVSDSGYSFPEELMQPFIAKLPGYVLSDAGFTLALEEKSDSHLVIRATANNPLIIQKNDSSENDSSTTPAQLGFSIVYTISNTKYYFDIEYIVSNLSGQLIAIGDEQEGSLKLNFAPGLFLERSSIKSLVALKPLALEAFTDIDKFSKTVETGGYTGVGLRDSYFCVLLESASTLTNSSISAKKVSIDGTDRLPAIDSYHIALSLPMFNLNAKEFKSLKFRAYAGPMVVDQLEEINRTHVSNYGFLSTLLLNLLRAFYKLYPNYGIAIILLTLLVRMILYPITLKQAKSMADMKKLQPLMQDLRDRYKDNPQKLNEETLKLYQKNNVNPLGGCLPMLIQIPIMFALFNTLRISVELRKMPFLWVTDLSKSDPLLILPIAVALLMYFQQTTMSTDPQQKQMMAFMPMFMFAISWSLPSGLVLYWFFSSLMGLLQQSQADKNVPTKEGGQK